MTSPAPKPRLSSPAAHAITLSSNSRQVVSFQMPLFFSRIATRSGNTSALRASTRISVVSTAKSQVDPGSARGMRASDIGLDHTRVGYDISGYAGTNHRAIIQRHHAIADTGDDIHVVLAQQHRDLSFDARFRVE